MPWSLRKQGGEWVVVNTETGKVKGHHGKNKAKGQRQLNLLRGVKHGWEPTQNK